jgi:hypothetical protein
MLRREPQKIYGLQVDVVKINDRIVDIKVPADAKKRAEFLKHFKQKNISAENDSYTGLVKRGLTDYYYHKKFTHHPENKTEDQIQLLVENIETCLKHYAKLERYINNPSETKSDDVFEQLNKLENDAKEYFNHVIEKFDGNAPYLIKLRAELTNNHKQFLDSIKLLQENTPTAEELQQLFCSQDGAIDGSTKIKSLGSYIAKQLHLITGYGIDEVYRITDNRMRQLFFTHPAIKALSDAKAHLELRALATKGAREENSQTPIPKETLDLIDSESKDDKAKKWLSLAPYISQFRDVEEVNKMLLVLSSDRKVENTPVRWKWLLKMFASSVIEIFPISCIHLFLSVCSFIGEGVCWALNIFTSKKPFNMKWLDHLATNLHSKFSLVAKCKNKLRENYTKQYSESKEFLNTLYENPKSRTTSSVDEEGENVEIDPNNTLNSFLSDYSGHRLATTVGNWFRGLGRSIKNMGVEIKFVLLPNSTGTRRTEAFVEKQNALKKEYSTKISDEFKKIYFSSKQKDGAVNSTKTGTPKKGEEGKKEKEEEKLESWTPGKPWVKNEFKSLFDIPGEIASGVADNFIGQMFRRAPGPATLAFIGSLASFTVLMVPTLSANAKSAWMGSLADYLSKNLTGKAVSDGTAAKFMSVFLQWKVSVLGMEVGTELYHGNIEFLRAAFKDLDKSMLILIILMSAGSGLRVFAEHPIPTNFHFHLADPNLHPWLDKYINFAIDTATLLPRTLNQLGEEAHTCSKGKFPFLEDLLLGAKVGLIAQSMVEKSKRSNELDAIKLMADLSEDITAWRAMKDKDADKLALQIKESLKKHDILEPIDEDIKNKYDDTIDEIVQIIKQVVAKDSEKISSATLSPGEEKGGPLKSESPLELATSKLKQAIGVVNGMECLRSSGFKSTESAWYFSDYLNDCFEKYITELDKVNLPTDKVRLLKERYLASFDNKYCDNHAATRATFLLGLPFYPLTIAWRFIRYNLSNSNCIKNEVSNSFTRDLTMFVQLLTDVIRSIREFARATSYVLRFIMGIVGVIAASLFWLPLLPVDAGTRSLAIIKSVLNSTTVISLHRFTPPAQFKAWYAKLARLCNSSQEKEYLSHWENEVLEQLKTNHTLPQNQPASSGNS